MEGEEEEQKINICSTFFACSNKRISFTYIHIIIAETGRLISRVRCDVRNISLVQAHVRLRTSVLEYTCSFAGEFTMLL